MTKKILFFIILCFFILNTFIIKSFYFNVFGNNSFKNLEYSEAESYFKKAENIVGAYNEANALYKQEKYIESIKKYLSIVGNDNSFINYSINHNLGNGYFRVGEKENEISKKIQYFEKSVDFYSKALDMKYDDETKSNLDFVLNKIKELKKQEKNKNEESNSGSKSETQTGGQDQNNSQKTSSGTKSETQTGSQNNSGSEDKTGTEAEKKSSEGQKKQENNLSKEQEAALEQYEKSLKESQKHNNENFNKVYSENNNPNDPFDIFSNDPFFNNDLLNGNGNKKDW